MKYTAVKPFPPEPSDPFATPCPILKALRNSFLMFVFSCRDGQSVHHVVGIKSPDLSDDGVEALLEPADGVVAGDAVGGADAALGAAAADDALTRAGHAAVEVHAVNTDTRVVLDAEIDVLADSEAEVAGLAEVALAQLVLLDLEATLENLLGLGATDGDVDGDLFVTADTKSTDGVAGLA